MKTFFSALFGAIIGSLITLFFSLQTQNHYLEYYTTENAVAVSPHDLRMEMDKGLKDTIIVDLRTKEEYDKEHITSAINIPGISPSDTDKNTQEQRIIQAFEKLPKDKRIIVHCYTHYCMLAKHVGLILAQKGIYVHELNIGWNEWRNEWDLWNGKGTSSGIDMTKYIEGTDVNIDKSGSSTPIIEPCTKDGIMGC